MLLCLVLMWRAISFSQTHGGMPYVSEDGRRVLNEHGRITQVEDEVYDEAVRRWRLGAVSVIVFLASMAGSIGVILFIRRGFVPKGNEH